MLKLPMRHPFIFSNLSLLLLLLLTTAAFPQARAALPSDEKKVESEMNSEDDGSVDKNKPELHADDGIPLEAAPEPPPTMAPPPPPEMKAEEPPNPPQKEPEPEIHPVQEAPLTYDGTTRATTSGRGEPLFDWSKHRGEQEVEHPFRERGLIRITKDREYIYKVKESEQKHAMSFRAGLFHPSRLANPDAPKQDSGRTFDENYSQSNAPAFMLTYEWQLWQTPIGKWALQVGSGAFIAQGNGHFVVTGSTSPNQGLTPREVFTFLLVPLNIGPVYRLQLFHRQMVVPYAEGGGTLFSFAELRDDNKGPKAGGSIGAYAAGGLALNLTYFDALSRIQLDREYGINAVYLTAEFRQIVSITQRYDFTSNMVNGGFLMEY